MGVELAFEVLQLGLRAAVFELLAGRFGAVPSPGHADRDAHAHDKQVENGVSAEEPHGILPGPYHGGMCIVGGQDVAETEVHAEHDDPDEQEVVEEVSADVPGGELASDEQEIVRVEDDHEGDRHEQEMGVLPSGHQRPVGVRDEERHAEDHGPDGQMDDPSRVFRLRSSHMDKYTKNNQIIMGLHPSEPPARAAFFIIHFPARRVEARNRIGSSPCFPFAP